MPIINNSFSGKMNLDVAPYRIQDGDYLDALNITKDAQGKGQDRVVSNIVGNTLAPYTLPSGTNKVIGFYADKIRNRAYYFIWNSNGNSIILYYNLNNNTIVKILKSKTDSDGIDILNFNPSYKILSVNLYYRDDEGDLLFFNDGLNPPKVINVSTNHGTNWKYEYLLVAKAPPIMPPKAVYENDNNVKVNNLRNTLFQFSYRFIYENNEKSVWSSNSIVPLPQQSSLLLTTSDEQLNSRISFSYSTGGIDVKKIELAFRETTNGVTSDWFLIESVNKSESGLLDNDITYYNFKNDSIYVQLDVIETTQLQDWVPQKANASELANGNVLLYSGITEGYDKTNMSLDANSSVATTDFFFDPCGLLFFAQCNGIDSGSTGTTIVIKVYGTGTNDVNNVIETLTNPIGKYVINAIDSLSNDIGIEYEYLSDTPLAVADLLFSISSAMVSKGWDEVTLVDNVLTMSFVGGFTLYSSGIIKKSTISTPKNTLFTNSYESGYQYALQYFDSLGRTIGAQTSTDGSFNTVNSSATSNIQFDTSLSISNIPPLEAKYYQVVRSNNTTYNKRLFWISDSAYTYNTLDSGEPRYAYIGINNIATYNESISSTANVVSYSFQDGDRIRFIRRYDVLGVPASEFNYDYEILGVVYTLDYTTETIPPLAPVTKNYSTSGIFLKIAYPTDDISNDDFNFFGGVDFQNYEIFLYNYTNNSSSTQKSFYEFGKCFGIGNAGTANRYHIGDKQTQTSLQPAIISTSAGDLFSRQRKVPLDIAYDNIQSASLQIGVSGANTSQIWSLVLSVDPDVNNSAYVLKDQIFAGGPSSPMSLDPLSTPVFLNSTYFYYNKLSIASTVSLKGDITVFTTGTSTFALYAMVVQSDGTKYNINLLPTEKNLIIQITAGGDSASFKMDTKITIPSNCKVWLCAESTNDAIGSNTLTINPFLIDLRIIKNSTIDIIESSFNDTYSLITNSNGRPTVIDINAKKTYFPTLIRFGQAYQASTNINGLNRFYYENFDEYDRSFGDVMRLHVRDRYLKVYQKFKVGNVPILTQIVKDSSNNPLQANTDTLINKIQYYSGDYGIGDASASLAWNNFSDYFVDDFRGVVCRLSQDGITPISITNNTNAFFIPVLKEYVQELNNGVPVSGGVYTGNPSIYGVFDAYTNKYIVAMEEINRYAVGGVTLTYHQDPFTISFDEVANSFESFYSYHPEMMGCLNTKLFSCKNGQLWLHNNNSTFANFYGVQYGASITTVFNQGSIDKKTWISLMETANTVWNCPVITTQMYSYGTQNQQSQLLDSDFEVLESEYHASFLKDINSIGGILEGNSLKGGYIIIKFEKTNANSFVYLNSATVKFIDSQLNNR